MIRDFHFLRPEWLLALAGAALLYWLISRREDARTRWRGAIAPHLLDHLLVTGRKGLRLRPMHLSVALIALGAVAAAGPTWQRERAPFVEDKAPLAIAIDLSPTMDAIDISPTRLERAKLKVRDLLKLRQGARTALFAYAGTAHMVLPLTDDSTLLQTYVDSLATRLMPVPGKDTARALEVIDTALAREDLPGTILLLTDGVEPRAFDAIKRHGGKNEIMVLAIGTAEGGPVRTGNDTFLTGPGGARVFAKLDVDGLRRLKSEADLQLATVTPDDADIEWIARRIGTHLEQKEADANAEARWRDIGWWLTIPIAILGALWFRQGSAIRWTALLLLALGAVAPRHADAADSALLAPWLTPDQQGRLAYDRGDFAAAATRFEDPMWKGVAFYRAGRFDEALESFARLDTADGYYNQGNCLAQLGKLETSAASYEEALKRRPNWSQAKANLDLIKQLIQARKKQDENPEGQDAHYKPDEIKFDDKGKQGKRSLVNLGQQTSEMWMRTIQTTPADLLARKFAIEAQQSPARSRP